MPAAVVHRGGPRRLPSAASPAHGSGMEINGEIEVDLDALGTSAWRWLAQAEHVAAGLEAVRIGIDGADLGPEVSEAIALLATVWSRAGREVASDLADHAASLDAAIRTYVDADSRAANRHQAAATRPEPTPAPPLDRQP